MATLVAAGCGDDASDPGTVSSTTQAPSSSGSTVPITSTIPAPSSSSSSSSSSTSGPAPGSTSTTARTRTTDPLTGAGMGPVTNSPDPSQPWLGQPDAYSPLHAVRLAAQDGFDRVVFEFEGALPGYLVAYGPTTVAATDDTPVTVAGGAGLAVTLYRGGQWLLDHAAVPRQVTGDTVAVTEARQIDDFEAVNRWLVGVDLERPFRVSTLDAPTRLVIDIMRDG